MITNNRSTRFRVVRRNDEQQLSNSNQITSPSNQKSGSVTVCGGSLKGRKVIFPAIPGLRPTVAKAREMIFSWLQQDVQGFSVLDLYAGSGILSFDCASRGAEKLVLVDKNSKVADSLALNANLLEVQNVAVKGMDVDNFLQSYQPEKAFDLIFIDPPYHYKNSKQLLEKLLTYPLLDSNTKIVIEAHRQHLRNTDIPDKYTILKLKLMGATTIMLLQPKPATAQNTTEDSNAN